MLTYDDCRQMCGVTDDVIDAIAEHEHVPTIIAVEMGQTLTCERAGLRQVRRFIIDDIRHAQSHANPRHARELRRTLHKFLIENPLH